MAPESASTKACTVVHVSNKVAVPLYAKRNNFVYRPRTDKEKLKTDRLMDSQTNRWADRREWRMDGWVGRWVHGWMDRQTHLQYALNC